MTFKNKRRMTFLGNFLTLRYFCVKLIKNKILWKGWLLSPKPGKEYPFFDFNNNLTAYGNKTNAKDGPENGLDAANEAV
ncbi:MAG: hypothetical protein U9R31_04610, partial [Candidatus Omnitrophota bacterium]|nr:hypothetical protein [Candidatus Omnitrophota bacterium]